VLPYSDKLLNQNFYFILFYHCNIILYDEDILFTLREALASEGYNVEALVGPTESFTHFVM
jgi:hypothetical protein